MIVWLRRLIAYVRSFWVEPKRPAPSRDEVPTRRDIKLVRPPLFSVFDHCICADAGMRTPPMCTRCPRRFNQ